MMAVIFKNAHFDEGYYIWIPPQPFHRANIATSNAAQVPSSAAKPVNCFLKSIINPGFLKLISRCSKKRINTWTRTTLNHSIKILKMNRNLVFTSKAYNVPRVFT